jgi:hypothetical protein
VNIDRNRFRSGSGTRKTKFALVCFFLVLLPGCATGPSKVAEDATSSAAGLKAQNADLMVEVNGIRDSSEGWLEYSMRLTNRGDQQLDQLRAAVTTEDGASFDAAFDSTDLSDPPKVGEQALTLGAISVGGMGLAVMTGIPLVGPLLTAGYFVSRATTVDDEIDTSLAFVKRSLTLKTLPGNDQISGSFFLPAVKPSSIKIGYVKNGRREWVVVEQGATQSEGSGASPTDASNPQASGIASSEGGEGSEPGALKADPALSVAEAQRRLALKGYDIGPADGIFGPRTQRAIMKFQAESSLPVTGTLDEATSRALLKAD